MPQERQHPPTGQWQALARFFARDKLYWLLVFVPISVAVWLANLGEIWVFIGSGLAIVPLAGLISNATDQLGRRTGGTIAGLLNATFGNATEFTVAIFALREGLTELVKASISGSIIGNTLLVLGLSMLLGGWGREKQSFSRVRAGANAAMLLLSVAALVMPAVFDLTVFGTLSNQPAVVESISVVVAIVLMVVYIASLVFELRTHGRLFTPADHVEPALLSPASAALVLAVSTGLVALVSELFVGSISAAKETLGLSEFFIGVVIVAVVGNAAEHATAVSAGQQNRMDLAMAIAVGSSTQLALFVAPLLVFISLLLGHPLAFVFNPFELAAITLGAVAVSVVILDGESNWFEGLQLVAVYAVMAIVFYFVPAL
jgi:Ca2+:H+ antiporter